MANKSTPGRGRQFGYTVSIILNLLILYGVNNLTRWGIPYLTGRFSECVWAFNLSLGATIFMYATFLVFDRRWFKHFMQAVTNVFSIVSIYIFRQVFPLDLPETSVYWANIGLLILIGVLILSTIMELFSAVRAYRKDTESE